MEHVTREFPSELRQVGAVRTLVHDTCRRAWGADAPEEALMRLQLAVSEAVANVILHGYEGKGDQPFEVVIAAGPHDIHVSLFHQGKAFDPSEVRPPSFDGSREGGFGVYLIRQAVDEVTYFQDERGRQGMRMVKKRPARAEPTSEE
jgi:anti-sigma regulatory factor (Ser/Thr protein kinase)